MIAVLLLLSETLSYDVPPDEQTRMLCCCASCPCICVTSGCYDDALSVEVRVQ